MRNFVGQNTHYRKAPTGQRSRWRSGHVSNGSVRHHHSILAATLSESRCGSHGVTTFCRTLIILRSPSVLPVLSSHVDYCNFTIVISDTAQQDKAYMTSDMSLVWSCNSALSGACHLPMCSPSGTHTSLARVYFTLTDVVSGAYVFVQPS